MTSMKKIFSTLVILVGAIVLAGCAGEEKDLFDKSAAERLNETGKIYTARLQSSEAGWVMEYYPTNTDEEYKGRGYVILADFDKDESVTLAMNNVMSDDVYMEGRSLWEIIADNGPVLTFNTYNEVLHCFSNPEYYESGKGFEGDYEFVMIDVPEDGEFIMLKGKKRGTYVRLTRLPAGTNFEEYLADIKAFHNGIFPANAVNENVLQVGDKKYSINNANSGMLGMYPHGGDAITETTTHPFLITKRDGKYYLRFRSAIEVDDETSEQEFVYDEANDRFVGTTNEANYIEGEDPVHFFYTVFGSDAHRWQWTRTSEMSESQKAALDEVASGFRALTNLSLRLVGENVVMRVQYRNSRNQNASVDFIFNVKEEADGITLKYDKPVLEAGANVLAANPALATYLETMSQKFTVTAGSSRFNMNTLRLTAASDSNNWIIVTYY